MKVNRQLDLELFETRNIRSRAAGNQRTSSRKTTSALNICDHIFSLIFLLTSVPYIKKLGINVPSIFGNL